MARHVVAPGLFLDEDDLEIADIRASGPGGQNVNKVASAVQMRLQVARLAGADAGFRARLARLAGRRLNAEGEIVLKAQSHRSQLRNREAALERLLDLLRAAARPPKTRRATRVPKGERRTRREAKRRRGTIKRLRGGPAGDEK